MTGRLCAGRRRSCLNTPSVTRLCFPSLPMRFPTAPAARAHSRNGADVFPFDPNGSYTGVPDTDPYPVQDADDL